MQKNKFVNLTHLGLLRISGDGAKKFLQGQLTCHLDEMQPDHLQLAAHCNPQGRVISLFHLFEHQNQYYLQMPRALVPIAANALKKYAVFFKTTIEDISAEWQQLGYIGTMPAEKAEDIITAAFNLAAPRFLYLVKPEALQAWQSRLSSHAEPGTLAQWQHLEISAKIPTLYPETSELFLPHELDLPNLNAVSFNKGCYTGQEIIARMHYRGKLKKHLYCVTLMTDSTPQRGADIYAQGNPAGNIVDYCHLGYNNYALLVTAQDEAYTAQQLALDAAGAYPFSYE